jgi:uncharacterized protein involved in exopolysaccharide biosynthesis
MDDLIRQARIILRGMWAHRRWGIVVAWGCGAALLTMLLVIPGRYEASARIFVNTDSILKPLMTGLTVQPNDEQRIVMLSRVVISRPNVERLVRSVGLDAEARTPEERERVVDRVMKTLEFKGVGRDNLYSLTFRDEDPVRAKAAIDQIAEMFIASSRGGKEEDTDTAKRFIEEQIAKSFDPLVRDRLYMMYGQEVEREMMAKNRNQFGFRMVDTPRVPDRKSRPPRTKIVLVSMALAALAGCFHLMVRRS